jgi:hypothetical protein
MTHDNCGGELTFTGRTIGVGYLDDEDEVDVWLCSVCGREVEVAARGYPGLYELLQAERHSLDLDDYQDYPSYDENTDYNENEDYPDRNESEIK